MSWLLENYWKERWIDRKLTFCNLDDHLLNIEDEIVQNHSVESFLQFTKVSNSMTIIKYNFNILGNLFHLSRAV
jgi:hypothetical protein